MEITLMADIAALAKSTKKVHLSTTEAERTALATRIGVLEVVSFEADMTAEGKRSGVYILKGTISAKVVQACRRTLEPVNADINEAFSVTFMTEDNYAEFLENEEEADFEDVEPLGRDDVNLAEIAIQYLSLALNPYPESDAVVSEEKLGDDVTVKSEAQHREETSPFAVLKKLDKKG